jgi:hypothetical protein
MRTLSLALLTLVAGCSEEDPRDVERQLTQSGGCADLVAYARNADDTMLLLIRASGLVSAAYDAAEGATDETTTFSFDLEDQNPHPEFDLIVEFRQGRNLSVEICNDVIEDPGPYVRRNFGALSGTLQIDLTPTHEDPEAWEMPASGTFKLTNVLLSVSPSGDGAKTLIQDFTFTANVGWFPG